MRTRGGGGLTESAPLSSGGEVGGKAGVPIVEGREGDREIILLGLAGGEPADLDRGPAGGTDPGEHGVDPGVVGVERLRHHDEVGGLLGVAEVEGLAGLGEKLTDLRFDLEGLGDLGGELPRLRVSGEVREHPLDLVSGFDEAALVEVVDRFDQVLVDRVGGRGLELGDDVREIDLGCARGQLTLEVGRRSERGVEPEHELEPDQRLLALSVLELRHHLAERGHDPFLRLAGEL